jgi:hypothetical protein
MQWTAGIDADPAYPAFARDAIKVTFRNHERRGGGLDHLRAMKIAADRERDLLHLRLPSSPSNRVRCLASGGGSDEIGVRLCDPLALFGPPLLVGAAQLPVASS